MKKWSDATRKNAGSVRNIAASVRFSAVNAHQNVASVQLIDVIVRLIGASVHFNDVNVNLNAASINFSNVNMRLIGASVHLSIVSVHLGAASVRFVDANMLLKPENKQVPGNGISYRLTDGKASTDNK